MAMRVYALGGQVLADGGCLFVVEGAAAKAGINWTLTGHGSLTAQSTATDGNGSACAKYNPAGGTPASSGDSITVSADVYA